MMTDDIFVLLILMIGWGSILVVCGLIEEVWLRFFSRSASSALDVTKRNH